MAPDPRSQTLTRSELAAYAFPFLGLGTCLILNLMLLMQFATEVLLVSPAVMGAILFASRVLGRQLQLAPGPFGVEDLLPSSHPRLEEPGARRDLL